MRNYRFSFGDASEGPFGAFISVPAGTPEEATKKLKAAMTAANASGRQLTVTMPGTAFQIQLHFNPKFLLKGFAEGVADPDMYDDPPRFIVFEHFNHFEIMDTYTGQCRPMGDGVDTVVCEHPDYSEECLKPGVPGFVQAWEAQLNYPEWETLEAYFPEMAEVEKAANAADEPIRAVATIDGNMVTFQRHPGGEYHQVDGDLKFATWKALSAAHKAGELR